MATTDELQQLFSLQTETLATEFKGWLDISTPQGRAPLAKAAIALANHGGGTIIMGMREANDEPIASRPRPPDLRRYTADAVNAAINRYADPHIHCDVVHLIHPNTGNEHAFIVVPGGHTVPIMSVRDLTGTIMQQRCYIRKPGPKSEEPFSAEEWRSVLNRCVQNGRESLLDAIRIVLQGQSLAGVSVEEIDRLEQFQDESIERWRERTEVLPAEHPARFMHGCYEQTYQIHSLLAADGLSELKKRMQRASEVKYTGWGPFVHFDRRPIAPVPAGDVIEAWIGDPEEEGVDGRHSDFWRAHPKGLLYERRGYDEDFTEKAISGTAIDLTMPVWRIGETLLYISRLAKEFDDDPDVSILIRYRGLKGRRMKSIFNWRYLSYDRKCVVGTVNMRGKVKASEIEENTVEILLPLLMPLYEAFEFAPLSAELVTQELNKLRSNRF